MSHRAKVLYAIQGTGNGHVSRARALFPELIKEFDVDLALIGKNSEVELPAEPCWKSQGISMEYDKKGRVDVVKTAFKNSPYRILNEIRTLPVEGYDFVINDFESISIRAAKRANIPVIGVSHQAAVLHPSAPKSKRFMPIGRFVLKHYAPVKDTVGFHFRPYGEEVLPPLLDDAVLSGEYTSGEHVLVYLPAYGKDTIKAHLKDIPRSFKIFHKSVEKPHTEGNLHWNSIDHSLFKSALLQAKAVVCGAGFELPSECLHHGIPLVVIPIQGQYEQWCNAEVLKEIGVKSLSKLKAEKLSIALNESIANPMKPANYPNVSRLAVERIKSWWKEMRK